MKPITDDIVLSLIEAAKRRQQAVLPANNSKPLPRQSIGRKPAETGRVITLNVTRPIRRVSQTISGVFFYAPRY